MGREWGDSVSPRLVQEISFAPIKTPDFAKLWVCGVNLSADIDMVDLWRDMAIFSSKLEIELKGCLGPLVMRPPFALSRLQVAYRAGCWEANYYGAVFGH